MRCNNDLRAGVGLAHSLEQRSRLSQLHHLQSRPEWVNILLVSLDANFMEPEVANFNGLGQEPITALPSTLYSACFFRPPADPVLVSTGAFMACCRTNLHYDRRLELGRAIFKPAQVVFCFIGINDQRTHSIAY